MYRNGAVFGFRAVVAWGLGLLACAPAYAQGDFLTQLYGSGVHAYFARDYREARETLTAAIEAGTKDPRCYYFRGLALMRLGRNDAAAGDFARGAELESSGGDRMYDINRALRRVQGRTRILLERHRAYALVTKGRRLAEYRANRYARIREAESVVTGPVPFDTSGEDRGTLQAPLPIPESVETPAAAGTPERATERAVEPKPPEEIQTKSPSEPTDDPFPAGEPPGPPEEMPNEAAGDKEKPADPFADDPAEESTDKDADPPATEKPVEDDPFADDESEMPAEEKPAEKPAEDDPFADDEVSKDKEADEPVEESDEDDPFADDDDSTGENTEESDEDDPFADESDDDPNE